MRNIFASFVLVLAAITTPLSAIADTFVCVSGAVWAEGDWVNVENVKPSTFKVERNSLTHVFNGDISTYYHVRTTKDGDTIFANDGIYVSQLESRGRHGFTKSWGGDSVLAYDCIEM